MAVVKSAKIELVWDDGHRAKIGTIEVDTTKSVAEAKVKGRICQRIGWDLIRTGMRVMAGRRKWKEEHDYA